jgi:hypothetical protein
MKGRSEKRRGGLRLRRVDWSGRLPTPAILVILWAGVLLHGWTIFSAMRTRVRNFDFSIYYASALALHENLDPYTTDLESVGGGLGLEIDPIHYATDPPTFLLMIVGEHFSTHRARS